jgi:ribosomal-protein-serine acetyltransferase
MSRFELSDDVHLRPLEEADADELYRLIDDNRSHLAPWMPWAAEQTLDGTAEFIRSAIAQEKSDDGFQVALEVGGAIAGVLGYHGVERKNLVATIGYWLASDRQGTGLITAAVAVLVSHAFDVWGLHRVEIRAAPNNTRSRAIPERLGFRAEGLLREAERFGELEFRDQVLYSILASEWRSGVARPNPPNVPPQRE